MFKSSPEYNPALTEQFLAEEKARRQIEQALAENAINPDPKADRRFLEEEAHTRQLRQLPGLVSKALRSSFIQEASKLREESSDSSKVLIATLQTFIKNSKREDLKQAIISGIYNFNRVDFPALTNNPVFSKNILVNRQLDLMNVIMPFEQSYSTRGR